MCAADVVSGSLVSVCLIIYTPFFFFFFVVYMAIRQSYQAELQSYPAAKDLRHILLFGLEFFFLCLSGAVDWLFASVWSSLVQLVTDGWMDGWM